MATRSSGRLVVLLVLLAIGIGFLARSFLGTGAAASGLPDAGPLDTARAADAAPAAAKATLAEPTPARAPEAAPAAAPVDRSTAATADELELADALWVAGTVVFPERTPIGEVVEVVASGRKFKSREPHRVRVGPDGRFRVAFAKGTKTGRIELDAPHLFLEEPLVVKLQDAPADLVLEPELGGRVLGVAVLPPGDLDEEGELARAAVQLFSWSPGMRTPVHRHGKLDAERRFEIRGVPSGVKCSLQLDTASFENEDAHVTVEPGEDAEARLELRRGVRLAGIVVDEAGQPIPSPQFAFESSARNGSSSSSGLSGEKDGTFVLRGLAAGKLKLTAQKQGYLPSEVELGELEAGDVREGLRIVLATGGMVAGRVLWPDGSPAVGAHVTAGQGEGNGMVFFSGVPLFKTAADGSFRIGGLGAGPVTVSATAKPPAEEAGEDGAKSPRKPGVRRARWAATAEGVAPGSDLLVLHLEEGFALSGRVVDDLGAPVERFSVIATPAGEFTGMSGRMRSAVVGRFEAADGSFVLEGVHAGKWDVAARAKGHVSAESGTVEVPATAAVGTITIARAAVLRGVVLGPDGDPAPRASVHRDEDDDAIDFEFAGSSVVTADAKGRFEMKDAPAGDHELYAELEGAARSSPLAISVAPGQTLDGLTLRLSPGARLVVELHAAVEGKRSGRQVSAYLHSEGQSDWRQATTNAEGRATLEGLAAGEWQVTVEPSAEELKSMPHADDEEDWAMHNALRKTARVTVTEGATVHLVVGAPPKDPIEVHGIVLRGGSPAADARVQAYFHGESGNSQKYARCDANGAYRLTVDQPGTYTFTVGRQASASSLTRRVEVAAGASCRQDFELSTGTISGRLLGPDGAPLEEGWVMLQLDQQDVATRDEAFHGWKETEDEGRFRFADLPPGRYTLTARAHSQSPDGGELSRESVHGVELAAGGEVSGIELRLSLAGKVTGIVRNSRGEPAEDAYVWLRDAGGAQRWDLGTSTDEDGGFEIEGVPPGAWTAGARADGEASLESASFRVAAGETARIELELRRATHLHVEVFEADGTAVGAAVTVTDARGRAWNHAASEDGGPVAAGSFPPGEYTVTARNHGGAQASATLVLAGEESRTVRLTLQ